MYPANNPPTDNQLWQLDYQPDGTFLIISKLHGKALDCGGQTQGSKLIVWDRHGGDNQRWRREGNYIVSKSGFMFDIEGSNRAAGAKVLLWSRNHPTSSNQQFDFVPVSVSQWFPSPLNFTFCSIGLNQLSLEYWLYRNAAMVLVPKA